MDGHVLWHLVVLGTTLLAAAGGAILFISPMVFEEAPRGLEQAKPYIWAVSGLAVVLLGLEWLTIHCR
ncbi:MAG: hypothetical protein H0U53_08990 [Actinobacteria bacterium]|nr:hypothetical protein [Actinomycetota bacterium]